MGVAAGKKVEEHLLGSGARMALMGMGSRKSLENRQAGYIKKRCSEENSEAAERCKRKRAMTSGELGKPPVQPLQEAVRGKTTCGRPSKALAAAKLWSSRARVVAVSMPCKRRVTDPLQASV